MASELKDASNDPVMDVEMSKPENEVVEQVDESTINVTNTGKLDEPMDVSSQCEEEIVKRVDEYSYLETGGFSTERFKVEIRNMPKFYGISEFKKLLAQKFSLKAGKMKPPRPGNSWLYVCFHSDEERGKAISLLNGFKWKGNELKVTVAQPTPDPFVRKRKLMEASEKSTDQKKSKEESMTQEEKIKNNTTPYWNKSYEEQLATKQQVMYRLIQKFANEIWLKHPELRGYVEANRKIHNGLICQYDDIKSAKKTEGYRNKCEFTIGMDDETKLPTVGFRIGSYVTGFTGVAPVDKLCHISDEMKQAVLLFQDFVRSSDLKVYSPIDHSGNWNSLMIRQSSSSGDLMLVVNIFSQGIDEDKLSNLKSSLVKHFSSQEAADLKISSLYYQPVVRRQSKEPLPKPEHLWGETHIYETILGIKFRISPEAFFQINTEGAEILYQTAIDMAEPKQDSTVVDICCGTGTIGLCFSKHCNQVLGVESVSEAVEDAKFNATANNITNAEFFPGQAENILCDIVNKATNQDVIAVIDPPRAGLHVQAVRFIRRLEQIKKLVFVSCDPAAAMKNFVDFSRAESKTMQGDPFILTKAVAVDMFPHTKHTELVLLFERMSPKDFPEETQMPATSQLISETPANTETQKKTKRKPRTRKKQKSIIITNTRRMIESHSNQRKKNNHANQRTDNNHSNQRADIRSNQRVHNRSNQRSDNHSNQRNDNRSNQSIADYRNQRNDSLDDQRYYKDHENQRFYDDGNLQRNYNAHYNERMFDDRRNIDVRNHRRMSDERNIDIHSDQRTYDDRSNQRMFDDRRNIDVRNHRRMSDERNIDIHSDQRTYDDRSNQRMYDDSRNYDIRGNQISYGNSTIRHNDDILNSTLSSVKKPEDESQTFGDFIATSLRNMKTEESRRLLKRKIQRAVLDVEELEDIDNKVKYPAQSSGLMIVNKSTWTQKVSKMNRLEAFEIWLHRRMLKMPWTDLVTHSEVLSQAELDRELLRTIKVRKISYLEHVIRGEFGPYNNKNKVATIDSKKLVENPSVDNGNIQKDSIDKDSNEYKAVVGDKNVAHPKET